MVWVWSSRARNPGSIDHSIIASCATQFHGKAGSAPAIERVQEQMKARGGHSHDIARLSAGQFYVSLESAPVPVKIATPMCLSWHARGGKTLLSRSRKLGPPGRAQERGFFIE